MSNKIFSNQLGRSRCHQTHSRNWKNQFNISDTARHRISTWRVITTSFSCVVNPISHYLITNTSFWDVINFIFNSSEFRYLSSVSRTRRRVFSSSYHFKISLSLEEAKVIRSSHRKHEDAKTCIVELSVLYSVSRQLTRRENSRQIRWHRRRSGIIEARGEAQYC